MGPVVEKLKCEGYLNQLGMAARKALGSVDPKAVPFQNLVLT